MNNVEIKNLNYSYVNKEIIKDISLSISHGSFNCILGPNGSGKTTLVKNIVKLLYPSKDTIYISNKEINEYKRKELSRKIALVPQSTIIEYDFTVEEIVMMGRMPYQKRFKTETEEDYLIVKESMIKTDTYVLKDRFINNLSGGEKQRAIIARAIAQEPQVLVLDEPVSYLDIHHQVEIMKLIKKLSLEKGITVITILHDVNLAIEYADNIVLLKDGKVYSSGSSENIVNEKSIKEVYDVNVAVIKNPITGSKYVIPY
ncbi:ABC transporter ATP-binding protein [Helicovermis profundi]|uniref:ABC transporter ATP-binding protein n=1 Tax=Helicovermis profundi TaxID=3065157 RepID=A0AAU9EB28_9FIRM|nr:ABC transporter ATP-binding protein [Clostridia bacterium S502]